MESGCPPTNSRPPERSTTTLPHAHTRRASSSRPAFRSQCPGSQRRCDPTGPPQLRRDRRTVPPRHAAKDPVLGGSRDRCARDFPVIRPADDVRAHGRGRGQHVLPPAFRGRCRRLHARQSPHSEQACTASATGTPDRMGIRTVPLFLQPPPPPLDELGFRGGQGSGELIATGPDLLDQPQQVLGGPLPVGSVHLTEQVSDLPDVRILLLHRLRLGGLGRLRVGSGGPMLRPCRGDGDRTADQTVEEVQDAVALLSARREGPAHGSGLLRTARSAPFPAGSPATDAGHEPPFARTRVLSASLTFCPTCARLCCARRRSLSEGACTLAPGCVKRGGGAADAGVLRCP